MRLFNRIRHVVDSTAAVLHAHARRGWHHADTIQRQLRLWLAQHWPGVRQRLLAYAYLTRMDKPIGTLLLLWPTLWALWIAGNGVPSLHLLLVFGLGTFLVRSAGCAVNDYADRNIDPHVGRTLQRPLATGAIRPHEAPLVAAVLLALAFGLVLTTNRFTVMLSLVALGLLSIYPFMKRYTHLPQLFLGLAFSWSIPMAYAAQGTPLDRVTWLLYIANLLWTMVFDTIYAMVDREYDLQIGVKSTAILFADADRFMIGVMQAMLLIVLVIVGRQLELGISYYSSLVLVVALMLYHQYLIRERDPEGCFRAFRNNHWLGAAVFAGIFFSYL